MNNPYDVLGISPDASIDEVKRAYKNKVNQYAGNAFMLNEIDMAYDSIVMSKNQNVNGSVYDSFDDIRDRLNTGRIDDAETLLDGIPVTNRNAEWFFLKGTIQQRRGWLESAAESFRQAYDMEPSNRDYKRAYESVASARSGSYGTHRETSGNSGCFNSPCNLCSSLLCADCCCECCGGDLIRCC